MVSSGITGVIYGKNRSMASRDRKDEPSTLFISNRWFKRLHNMKVFDDIEDTG
jgi:hypothetical protein